MPADPEPSAMRQPTSAGSPSSPRILEIAQFPYFKAVLPAETVFVSTGPDPVEQDEAGGHHVLQLRNLRRIWRMLHEPGFDLIVCRPPFFAPWDARWLGRTIISRRMLSGNPPFLRAFGSQLLRGKLAAPLAVIDQEDIPYVDLHNFHLLDACRFWFKRELPPDHWRIFQRTGHRDVPTPRFRRLDRYRSRIEKLRPMALGLPLSCEADLPATAAAKSVDVFFAGGMAGSSTVRERGLGELLALRDRGVSVDIAEQRLPRPEFYARMARARLVWSPEGLGWDCFRHYEAAACFAVPLISRPTIERYRPLVAGEHALYYDVEPGGLTAAVTAALGEERRLEAMAAAGRAHVLAHHTALALATHIIDTTLGAAEENDRDR
jgi:hypothetical protein